MTKSINTVVLGFAILASASVANAAEPLADAPAWIGQKIAEFDREPPHARRIYAVTYRGAVHYYFAPRCCDAPGELYDVAETLVCYPAGGFASRDERCADFVADPKQMTLIWAPRRVEDAVPSP